PQERSGSRVRLGAAARAAASAATLLAAGLFGAGAVPERFGSTLRACESAREHEQQVREPVQVMHRLGTHLLGAREPPAAALGSPADGARHVRLRGGAASAREYEFLERRESAVELLDL